MQRHTFLITVFLLQMLNCLYSLFSKDLLIITPKIRGKMSEVINLTNFEELPGQDGDVYRCKVGDASSLKHAVGDLVAVVRTDRISAYDTILPNSIAHKGQVINEMSHVYLSMVKQILPR